MTDREVKSDCAHICVCPLSHDEEGSKLYCNTPLKLFRNDKSLSSPSERNLETHVTGFGECMHQSVILTLPPVTWKKITYGLSENEKVLTSMGYVHTHESETTCLHRPCVQVVVMMEVGPVDTKGKVWQLTRPVFKGFTISEFQVTCTSTVMYSVTILFYFKHQIKWELYLREY